MKRLILIVFHAAAMFRVLFRKKNRAKGTWRGMAPEQLTDMAAGELEEFHREVLLYRLGMSTVANVEAEAADASSYMAMVVDNLRAAEWRERFPGPGPLWPMGK